MPVPGNITLHASGSTKASIWGTKIESSLLVLQKRVIWPKMHSSKEQNCSPSSVLTGHNLTACQCLFLASLHRRLEPADAQVPSAMLTDILYLESGVSYCFPRQTHTRASHLSVLNSRMFTWPASGQRPSPREE